jgi:small-conductance mechanosensitive channel
MTASLLLSLLWFLSVAANAQGLLSVPKPDASADTTPEVSELPDPGDLATDWFLYYDVEGEELETRLAKTMTRIDSLAESLPESIADQAKLVIEHLRANLNGLLRLLNQEPPEVPLPVVPRDHYSTEQLAQLAARERRVRSLVETLESELKANEKAIRSARSRYDTMFALYRATDKGSPERLLQGLELMAARASVAVANHQLEHRELVLSAQRTSLVELSREVGLGGGRLVASPTDLGRLDRAVAEAKAAREEATLAFIAAQSRSLGVMGDTPEEETATVQYREQKARLHGAAELIASVNLIGLEAERTLIGIILSPVLEDADALRKMVDDWTARLADARVQAQQWRAESVREREGSNALIATSVGGADGAVEGYMTRLYQDRLRLAQETLASLTQLADDHERATLMLNLIDRQIAARESWLDHWWEEIQQLRQHIWSVTVTLVSTSLFRVGETPITSLGIIRVIVIVCIAWLLSTWLRRFLQRVGERRGGASQHAVYTIGRLSHYLIIFVGLMIGLSSVGVDFTNFALVAGALSIGIGFGLQSIVNNFVSGIIILFERSLKVGDYVELGTGVSGVVREINVRSTRINTNENVDVIVPNSNFISSDVINWTLQEHFVRFHVPFGVAYGVDKEHVREVVLEAAKRLPFGLTGVGGKDADVWLVKYGENRMEMELVVWVSATAVKRPATVKAKYLWAIDTALQEHHIPVPLPQRDLHLVSGMEALAKALRGEGILPAKREPAAADARASASISEISKRDFDSEE